MGGFGTSNASNQTIPQISLGRLILDMVEFGVFDLPNPPMSQTYLVWDIHVPKLKYIPGLIWDIPSLIWDINQHSNLGCPKSAIPIWDIPSWIWDMVEFGLQHSRF